ncbi:helix-turn-helix domain-containing protein [Nocardiopsis mangrovi]|uniref:Helix-turn-helix domain-containing protein n=1 Tax=Nocardiopsis mangrovi TaxID=1179818 RepID=A0ABV9E0M1_9ACTN
MPERDGALPPEFWSRPTMAGALATCDMAAIVEGIRVARGWSQGDLALTVGYSQSWVSRVVNRQQSLTIEQVRDLTGRLGIPVHLLRFASPAVPGKGADPTRRRDFGKVMAAAALPLPAAPPGGDLDDTTAPALRAITGGQRRLDASSPARDLAQGAVAHVDLTARTLERARHTPLAPDIAGAAAEAAGFAAWLHADMGDHGSARAHYGTAVRRAREAGDRLLNVYMLGSLASFETDADDPALGLALAGEAGRRLGPSPHPTAAAWLACVRAMAHAELGGSVAAVAELRFAEQQVGLVDNTDPPWPWVFPFDHAKVAGCRALVAVRRHRPGEARAAFAVALAGARPGAKQGALLMAELAAAHADAGDVDEAFLLAAEALRTGRRLGSERVVARVRRFRRAYRGPGARCISELDEELASGLVT